MRGEGLDCGSQQEEPPGPRALSRRRGPRQQQRRYSYDDMPLGKTDATLAQFGFAADRTDKLPVLKRALAINPQLFVEASPWSPPGRTSIVTSDNVRCGTSYVLRRSALATHRR